MTPLLPLSIHFSHCSLPINARKLRCQSLQWPPDGWIHRMFSGLFLYSISYDLVFLLLLESACFLCPCDLQHPIFPVLPSLHPNHLPFLSLVFLWFSSNLIPDFGLIVFVCWVLYHMICYACTDWFWKPDLGDIGIKTWQTEEMTNTHTEKVGSYGLWLHWWKVSTTQPRNSVHLLLCFLYTLLAFILGPEDGFDLSQSLTWAFNLHGSGAMGSLTSC